METTQDKDAIKEKLTNLRELFRWYLFVLVATFAGTVSMVLEYLKKETFIEVFLSFGGFTLVVIFYVFAQATWMNMNDLIKDMER